MLRVVVIGVMLFSSALACTLSSGSDDDVISAEPTNTTLPEMPIVYYYFAAILSNTFPAGSVVIVPDQLILSPTVSTIPRTNDSAENIRLALQAMMNDPSNVWTSSDLALNGVTFDGSQAMVTLSGTISGPGDTVLIAARVQLLLTVFAESAVQTAVITLNGENIGNLGISHSSESKPANYAYTRAEVW
ncbi:MAG TPA: hypothetical protein VHP83_09890 [Aggregatilineaceae bacterium]|nr:hypothetical protein [Aggregatilineaceae bacterium]